MKKDKKTLIEKLGNVITLFGNAILMNLMFLVMSLPLVTIGQAWCGLLSAIRYNIRGEKWFKGFWAGFKTRFFRGTIIWCLGLVVCYILLGDINQALAAGATNPMIVSCARFGFVAMILQSALLLNVYIYTNVSNWLRNTVNLIFKGFIPLLLGACFFWLPVVLLLLVDAWIIFETVMIWICAYFVVVALVLTLAMKKPLTQMLVDCRAEGLIIGEEGANKDEVEIAEDAEESGEEA